MADPMKIRDLTQKAYELRRRLIELSYRTGILHLGGDLSAADFVTALYNYKMSYRPQEPKWEGRDRLIMSKGHCGAVIYVAQAMLGCHSFEELFSTYRKVDSRFGMHPCSNVLDTLEISTGSLGHGLSLGVGFALAARLDEKSYRTYVILGDGETDEGSVWEAALLAPQFRLGNLIAIVDRNCLSLDGFTEEIVALEPYADKWRAFNWNVVEIDGNDMAQICTALDSLPAADSSKPTLILAHTVKGKGVPYMENRVEWHAGIIANQAMYEQTLNELEDSLAQALEQQGGHVK